jgi:hypothetical protein
VTLCWPNSFTAITSWSAAHGVSLGGARLRFIKFCVLESIASDPRLSKILILRGSAALQLFYGGRRESADLDFVVLNIDGSPVTGDDPDAPKPRLHRILAERLPRYCGGDNSWQTWFKSIKIDLTPATCVYDCVRMPLPSAPDGTGGGKTILVVTPEIIVSEKLAAISNAIQRQKSERREHDVYDVAWMLRSCPQKIDVKRIGELARRKADQEDRRFCGSEFDSAGRDYVGRDYERLRHVTGSDFIPFEQAWQSITDLIGQITPR